MARPVITIDIEQLKTLMRWKPTQRDCAAFFQCSEDTIDRRIKDETGLTFTEFRESQMVFTKSELIAKAIMRATIDDSDTMLIFCLKNLCNWRDKHPDETGPAAIVNNNTMAVTEERLVELIRAARGK